jgi:hypothetical protein
VAHYNTVCAVLAVAALERLELRQFDVKMAFLYGTLQEEVYSCMCQPEGFDDGSGRVRKLKRSLYGLKQAPRGWNQQFIDFMKKKRLKVSTADPCLVVRQHNSKKLNDTIYVDDSLTAGSN